MRRLSIVVTGLVLALLFSVSTAAAANHASPDLAVTATNRLALAMLNRVSPDANAVMSPFSVETALAMIDQGADAQTAAQIDRVLADAPSPTALGSANRLLDGALNEAVSAYGTGGPTFNSANDVWLQSGLTLANPFQSVVSTDFGVSPQQADFRDDPAAALQTINDWVANRTHGLIRNLLTNSEVTAATTMVLANAIYLHAAWLDPFPGGTDSEPFTTPSGTVQAPFMSNEETVNPYAATSRYQAVALDYAHSSLQYVAVMPPADQIDALTRWLTVSRLARVMASLRSSPMTLEMPKYTLNLSTVLNGFLQGLGITDVFNGGLDRMVKGQPQQLSFLVHAATLKVAQRGTTAAAATAGGVTSTAAPVPDRLDVDLNHPFLVFIRDTRTGAVLFAARVVDPTA